MNNDDLYNLPSEDSETSQVDESLNDICDYLIKYSKHIINYRENKSNREMGLFLMRLRC